MSDADVVYDEETEYYDPTLNSAITKRIKEKLSSQRQAIRIFALVAAVTLVIAFLLNVIIGNSVWPMVVSLGLIFGWLLVNTKFIMPFRVTVNCPSCDELINFNNDWVCGSCGGEKSPLAMQTYIRHSLPLEPCEECKEEAAYVECPYCSAELFANTKSQESSETIARFL